MFNYKEAALEVIDIEMHAISQLKININGHFSAACELLMGLKGKVVVMGMGKSGHIGKKIAATLASTGTPAFFVHPGEASHGDLGMISRQDVVIAISNSGESSEILALYAALKRLDVKIIVMAGQAESTMVRLGDVFLPITVPREACPLGLAPTSSTTATLVMGDALAVALLKARGFTTEEFAFSHPGGILGRKLLIKLADLMHSAERCPRVAPDTIVCDALLEISEKGLGMTSIIGGDGQLLGIFTDGDLRRLLDKKIDIYSTQIKEVMIHNPTVAHLDMLAIEGLNLMQEKSINGLIVCDDTGRVIGALNMHDMLKAGVV